MSSSSDGGPGSLSEQVKGIRRPSGLFTLLRPLLILSLPVPQIWRPARISSNNPDSSWGNPVCSPHENLDEQVARLDLTAQVRSLVSVETYSELSGKIESIPTSPSRTQETLFDGLPNKDTLCWLISLYFDRFHPVYPFLDQSHLNVPSSGWSVCLGTAAIGARYVESEDAEACSDALGHLLYRALTWEYDLNCTEPSLFYTQASVLNVIGLWQSHHTFLSELGFAQANKLFAACSRLGLLFEIVGAGDVDGGEIEQEASWIRWRVRESRRRTGLFIWMLDCILALIAGAPVRFSLRQMELYLPSSEELWDASTAHSWQELRADEPEQVPLHEALQKLYFQRHLNPRLSEFAKTALIHALIYRMWDVQKFFLDPLAKSSVTGSIIHHTPLAMHFRRSPYPGTVPEIAKWRNISCDALDVLHWDAHRVAAEDRRTEPPIYLSLHLARTVLLAPVAALEGMIRFRCSSTMQLSDLPHNAYIIRFPPKECDNTIRTWIKRDKYKARLATVHAAATFWHVRRYSSDSFVQPFAVFLATIIVWAYGSYTFEDERKLARERNSRALSTQTEKIVACHEAHGTQNGNQQRQEDSQMAHPIADIGCSMPLGQSAPDPQSPSLSGKESSPFSLSSPSPEISSFFNIDRPCDDEIVQHFIRVGPDMKIFMEGIGEVCSERGPQLVLRQGARLLKKYSANVWPAANHYAKTLEAAAVSP